VSVEPVTRHGRRQYVDEFAHFSEEVEQVLELYKTIWINEDETINQSMTSADSSIGKYCDSGKKYASKKIISKILIKNQHPIE
jgi:hypothetical protein